MTEHVDNIIEAIKAQAQAYQLLKAEMVAGGVDVDSFADASAVNQFSIGTYNKATDMVTVTGAALIKAFRGEWQPIETAPEDGTPVLSYGEEGHSIVDYFQGAWYDSAREIIQPTHWMPLPNPPEDV